jgi:hypothetical protein
VSSAAATAEDTMHAFALQRSIIQVRVPIEDLYTNTFVS